MTWPREFWRRAWEEASSYRTQVRTLVCERCPQEKRVLLVVGRDAHPVTNDVDAKLDEHLRREHPYYEYESAMFCWVNE